MKRLRKCASLSLVAGVILSSCLAVQFPLHAAMTAEESQRVLAAALEHFYNLEYDQAIATFERLREDDPRNPKWQNHVALGYFYKQLLHGGALEGDLFGASNRFFRKKKFPTDRLLQERFYGANHMAVELCERTLKADPRNEAALYSCGVAYAARAAHQGLIERSALNFLGNAHKANEYHSRLVQINPRLYDGYLVPGIYDFVLGSLPGPVKVLFFFAGLTGDKQRGLHLVESVSEWGNGAKRDAQILLTVMYRREKRFADARRTLEGLAQAFPRNYIFPLEIASVHRAAEELPQSIRQYELVLDQVHAGTPNYTEAPVARIYFELGVLYRRTGDMDAARRNLQLVEGSRGSNPELTKESAVILAQLGKEPQ
ncbi:MAG: tetratricopeptide repeat protein [Acidobacteria bacterium]|nr:tetratricopeptide repeat protein [Acidobacteriota bacterium]